MPSKMILLLPPSEGKAVGGVFATGGGVFAEALREPRESIVAEIKNALIGPSSKGLERIFGVRGKLLERSVQAMAELVEGRAPVLPAYQRYTGVVWKHLDPENLSAKDRARIIVPSGLYGVTTGEDGIADYRLKMDVSLGQVGNLAKFWQPALTKCLIENFKGSVVINLLPKEHEAAIDLKSVAAATRFVAVEFVASNGSKAAGHDAKAVKGILARELLVSGPTGLEDFRWRGWRAKEKAGSWKIVAPSK